MKRWIKRVAGRVGLHLYTDASLATGVDRLHDIRRSRLVGATSLYFDVGAIVGQTVQALKRARPAARVRSDEPNLYRNALFVSRDRHLPATPRGLQ